jgi:hypothetical protein
MLDRPGTPSPARDPRRVGAELAGTRPVAALAAAAWAAGVGLVAIGVLVTLAWAITGRGDDGLATPVGASGVVWLVAHHAAVSTPLATVTLLPLTLLALPLFLLFRAGRWSARITGTTRPGDAAVLVLTGTATYSVIALLVCQLAALGPASVPPVQAVVWAAVVGAAGLGAGVVAGAGLSPVLRARLGAHAPRSLTVAGIVGAGLAAASGIAVLVALVARWDTVTGMHAALATSAGDHAGVVLLTLAYLPNLLVWALAYLAGPGFAVGGGAVVDPFTVSGGMLPGVPVLGAIPLDAPVLAPALVLVPVVLGGVAVAVLRRRGAAGLVEDLVAAGGGALVVGVGAGLLAWLAGGSLGAARLAPLGPAPFAVAAALTGLVAAGGCLVALVAHLLPTLWVPRAGDAPAGRR